jgi:hypothetical protein
MPVGDPVMFSGRLKTCSGLAGNQNLPFMDGHYKSEMLGNRSPSKNFYFQKVVKFPSHLIPEFCTSRRLSYAPIAGFPLRSNKALKGEVIVNYYEPLITKQMEASGLPFG